MAELGGVKPYAKQVYMRALALAVGIWLTIGGVAVAAGCSNNTPATWLPASVVSPDPADRQAIMDLIHSYLWSLDERNIDNLSALFSDDSTYETCRGGGAVQIAMVVEKKLLTPYISNQFADLVSKGFQTRHIESNTLLHSKGTDTVDGKSTMLVSLHRAVEANIPELDYTAVVLWSFIKDGDTWKIAKVIVITDTPEVEERAR